MEGSHRFHRRAHLALYQAMNSADAGDVLEEIASDSVDVQPGDVCGGVALAMTPVGAFRRICFPAVDLWGHWKDVVTRLRGCRSPQSSLISSKPAVSLFWASAKLVA